ncbi:MAG: DUF5667 domain-containing protein [Anaerolineales bacterium]
MSDKNLSLELAKCLEWMEKTGCGPKAAAERFPNHYQELFHLLQTVEQLDASEKPAPSQEFLSVARTRLVNRISAEKAAAQQSDVTKSRTLRHIWQSNKMGSQNASQHQPQRRFAMNWILIIGLIASVFAGGGGVAYASTDALPGDSLYPVKTMLQDMEMVFASDEKDAEMLMTQLFTNIEDMQQLAEQGRFSDILIGLKEYQSDLEAMNQLRARVGYDEAGSETSLNIRLQEQLQDCTLLLEQLQIKLKTKDQLQTQDQLHTMDQLQDRLQEAIQLTDTGNTYGPNEEPGQPDELGEPNGVGPGEPQGPEDQMPADSGNPDTGCQGDDCNTEAPGGPAEDPGKGPGSDSGSGGGGGSGKP